MFTIRFNCMLHNPGNVNNKKCCTQPDVKLVAATFHPLLMHTVILANSSCDFKKINYTKTICTHYSMENLSSIFKCLIVNQVNSNHSNCLISVFV